MRTKFSLKLGLRDRLEKAVNKSLIWIIHKEGQRSNGLKLIPRNKLVEDIKTFNRKPAGCRYVVCFFTTAALHQGNPKLA